MRTQLWTPDTCNCKIEEIEQSPDVWVGGNVIRKCADHADVPDNELYGVLYANPDGENKVKNQVEGYLLGRSGEDFGFHEQKLDKEGNDAGIGWKKGLKYEWSFEGKGKNRKFRCNVKGGDLTPHKAKMKKAFDSRFSSNKVIL